VGQDDFSGLRHLADRLGDDFIVGLVLYTGQQTLSFGPRLSFLFNPCCLGCPVLLVLPGVSW
jgi:hypothetical protein